MYLLPGSVSCLEKREKESRKKESREREREKESGEGEIPKERKGVGVKVSEKEMKNPFICLSLFSKHKNVLSLSSLCIKKEREDGRERKNS